MWGTFFPRPEVSMRKVDWRIVGALREDERKELAEVSKAPGVSVRTIQRRLNAIRDGRAIHLSGPNPTSWEA
jgi:DNA-binding Lrp family transcriptional regulator